MCFPPVAPTPPAATATRPLVSFLIGGRGRRDILLQTLARVERCGLAAGAFEVLVLDDAPAGATGDPARDVVADHFPLIHLMAQSEPRRTFAREEAVAQSRGEVLVLLEEDSFPRPGSVERAVEHLHADSALGAAVFTVARPDGTREDAAFPGLVLSSGTAFRRAALEQVGGLARAFSRRAEEFDLSMRLLSTGWRIRPFDDLHATHFHSPGPDDLRRAIAQDADDSLALAGRYFPRPYARLFARDWLRHCRLLAATHGTRGAYRRGRVRGAWRAMRPGHRRPVSLQTFEHLTHLEETERRLRRAQDRYRLARILLVDWCKSTPTFHLAARRCGIEVVAVADAKLAGTTYRGVQVLSDERAVELEYDAAVIGDLNPGPAAARRDAWRQFSGRPVIDLAEDDALAIRPYAARFRLRRAAREEPAAREEIPRRADAAAWNAGSDACTPFEEDPSREQVTTH